MAGIHCRVLLELGGDLPLDRLCRLLEAVDRWGSINQAAAGLGMSYRFAWGLVRKAEARLGRPLLDRRIGGRTGGGAGLTGPARDLLDRYWQFHDELGGRLDHIFAAAPPAGGTAPRSPVPERTARHPPESLQPEASAPVLLASTIGPSQAGLVAALADRLLAQAGILVRHLATGSGQALDIARNGRVDLILTHDPPREAAFAAAGFGTGRCPLMYNDFVLVGPAADGAGILGAGTAAGAFRRIAAAGAPFVSRGDRSGTHARELALWKAAGVTPAGPWYRICPRGALGSHAVLQDAEQFQAYTLVDRAVYLGARARGLDLYLLLAGDPALRNDYALVPVNPDRFPWVQHSQAMAFVAWATGPDGQALISQFGADQYGEPLFRPVHGAAPVP